METTYHTESLTAPPADRPPRSGLSDVALVYCATLLLAIALSPLVYLLIKTCFPDWSKLNATNPDSLMTGFDRVFSRIRMISAVLMLPWLLRRAGLWSLDAFGLRWSPETKKRLTQNLVLGIAMLGAVLAAQFLALDPNVKSKASPDEVSWWAYALASAFLTASLVSLFEETLFRGYLQKVFQHRFGPWLGIGIGALVFASLHFRTPPPDWQLGEPGTWSCALNLAIGQSIGFFWTAGAAHFTNLVLAGLCLGLLTWRTGSLWAAIGLHAGWVVVRSVYLQGWRIEPTQPGGAMDAFWGSTSLVNGWATTLPLLLLAVSLALSCRRQRP